MLYNERAIKKVLTCLYLDNDLIISPDYPLRLNDFALKKYQAIYSSLYNLYSLGNNNIDISDIIGYFQQQATMYGKFVEDGGMDALYEICNDATAPNFEYNYKMVKRYALLTDLQAGGIDITDLKAWCNMQYICTQGFFDFYDEANAFDAAVEIKPKKPI